MFVQRFRAVSLLGILMAFVVACGGRQSAATPTPLPPIQQYEPTIFTVERGPIVADTIVTGQIVPSRQDELFFRTSGFVERVLVKEGDYVNQGDLLGEMKVDDILNQLEQARIDLQVAEADFAKAESVRKFAVDRAELEVAIAEAKVALSELDIENSYSTDAKERAELNLIVNQCYLDLAKIALQEARDNSEYIYEAQSVDRAQLTVDRLEGYLAERQILAPYDGVVLRSRIRAGNSIDAFETALVVGDPTETVVRSPMDWDLRNVLNKNSEITLQLSSDEEVFYPVQFLPNFVPISSAADESASSTTEFLYFSVPSELQQDNELLSAPVNLEVVLGREDDALLLPPAAIRSYRGLDFVIVVDGEERHRVEIYEIGLKTPDRWEVIADLEEGDQVLGP